MVKERIEPASFVVLPDGATVRTGSWMLRIRVDPYDPDCWEWEVGVIGHFPIFDVRASGKAASLGLCREAGEHAHRVLAGDWSYYFLPDLPKHPAAPGSSTSVRAHVDDK